VKYLYLIKNHSVTYSYWCMSRIWL